MGCEAVHVFFYRRQIYLSNQYIRNAKNEAATPHLRIGVGFLYSSIATKENSPLTAFSRSSEYICSTNISTLTFMLVFPTWLTVATSSTIVPAGIGCVKSILSLLTVTIFCLLNLVAQIKATSSIIIIAVPPKSVS